MKAFFEEYGTFLVAAIVGIALCGILAAGTVANSRLMQRLIPDERNMTLSYLDNAEVVDSSKIPQMNIVNAVTVLINPNNEINVDFMSSSIVKKVTDGEGNTVTRVNYVPQKYARDESRLKKDYLNIIGYDAVNTQVKGDYKVTYSYENSNTGYKNYHDLVICVRRPYIPFEYIKATGTQYISTGIVPRTQSTIVTIEYEPLAGGSRQDVVYADGSRMSFGIFVQNGKWGYSYNNNEVLTNITASGKTEVTLDSVSGEFTVGSTVITFDNSVNDNAGDGYIRIFKAGQKFGKLYTVQISEGEELRRNMFAAYAKTTDTIGLWDTITWSSFYNEGESYPEFEYGDEIDE